MLKLAGIDIQAVSVGGLETCIEIPGWGLCFDIGRCPSTAVRRERICVTHAHMDHAGGLAYHAATRDLLGMKPPTYYVPRENHADFLALFDVWRRLDRSDLPAEFVPVGPGDRIELDPLRSIVPFRSPHRVHCQGYALVRKRPRLRRDLAGLPQDAIRDRRLAGEDVSELADVAELAFTGDALIEVVDREPLVRTAKVLVMEVTFLDERVPVEACRAKGHIHLDEVIARADRFENERILFTHFSARYGPREIQDILARRLPASLRDRVVPLLPG